MYNIDLIVAHSLKCSNCVYFFVIIKIIIIIIIIIIYDNVQDNLKDFVIKTTGLRDLNTFSFLSLSGRTDQNIT